jgi:hypothetical protein
MRSLQALLAAVLAGVVLHKWRKRCAQHAAPGTAGENTEGNSVSESMRRVHAAEGGVAAQAAVRSHVSAGSDDKKGTGIAFHPWSEHDKAKTFQAEGGVGRGIAALTAAAGAGEKEQVARLVKGGTDIEGRHNGLSALLCAAGEGHASTVAWLLENKADVSATAPNGMTARVCSLPPRVCMPLALSLPTNVIHIPPSLPLSMYVHASVCVCARARACAGVCLSAYHPMDAQ